MENEVRRDNKRQQKHVMKEDGDKLKRRDSFSFCFLTLTFELGFILILKYEEKKENGLMVVGIIRVNVSIV